MGARVLREGRRQTIYGHVRQHSAKGAETATSAMAGRAGGARAVEGREKRGGAAMAGLALHTPPPPRDLPVTPLLRAVEKTTTQAGFKKKKNSKILLFNN